MLEAGLASSCLGGQSGGGGYVVVKSGPRQIVSTVAHVANDAKYVRDPQPTLLEVRSRPSGNP